MSTNAQTKVHGQDATATDSKSQNPVGAAPDTESKSAAINATDRAVGTAVSTTIPPDIANKTSAIASSNGSGKNDSKIDNGATSAASVAGATKTVAATTSSSNGGSGGAASTAGDGKTNNSEDNKGPQSSPRAKKESETTTTPPSIKKTRTSSISSESLDLIDSVLFRLTDGIPKRELKIMQSEADQCEEALLREIEILENYLNNESKIKTLEHDNLEKNDDNQSKNNLDDKQGADAGNTTSSDKSSPPMANTVIDSSNNKGSVVNTDASVENNDIASSANINAVNSILENPFTPVDRYFTFSSLIGRLRDDFALPSTRNLHNNNTSTTKTQKATNRKNNNLAASNTTSNSPPSDAIQATGTGGTGNSSMNTGSATTTTTTTKEGKSSTTSPGDSGSSTADKSHATTTTTHNQQPNHKHKLEQQQQQTSLGGQVTKKQKKSSLAGSAATTTSAAGSTSGTAMTKLFPNTTTLMLHQQLVTFCNGNDDANNFVYIQKHTEPHALLTLWRKIASHRTATVFRRPVKNEEAPGYNDRILFPMDLSLIRKMIVARIISSYRDFRLRVALISHNCVKYNGRESDYGIVAREFEAVVDEYILHAVLSTHTSQSTGPSSLVVAADPPPAANKTTVVATTRSSSATTASTTTKTPPPPITTTGPTTPVATTNTKARIPLTTPKSNSKTNTKASPSLVPIPAQTASSEIAAGKAAATDSTQQQTVPPPTTAAAAAAKTTTTIETKGPGATVVTNKK